MSQCNPADRNDCSQSHTVSRALHWRPFSCVNKKPTTAVLRKQCRTSLSKGVIVEPGAICAVVMPLKPRPTPPPSLQAKPSSMLGARRHRRAVTTASPKGAGVGFTATCRPFFGRPVWPLCAAVAVLCCAVVQGWCFVVSRRSRHDMQAKRAGGCRAGAPKARGGAERSEPAGRSPKRRRLVPSEAQG